MRLVVGNIYLNCFFAADLYSGNIWDFIKNGGNWKVFPNFWLSKKLNSYQNDTHGHKQFFFFKNMFSILVFYIT